MSEPRKVVSSAVVQHSPQRQLAPAEIPFEQMVRMAQAVAKSGLFGMKDENQALSLMLIAQSEGRHPASVARDYHVFDGKPSMKADTILARFQADGGSVKWTSYTDAKVEGVFSHPAGGEITVDWDMKRAQMAGLSGKNVWKSYPRAMMRARVISEAVRTLRPGVMSGMYSSEEVQDMEQTQTTEVPVDPSVVATQPQTPAEPAITEEDILAHIKTMEATTTVAELAMAFAKAWEHGSKAKNEPARKRLKGEYDRLKAAFAPKQDEGAPL